MDRKPFSSRNETDTGSADDGLRPRLLVEAASAGAAAARGRERSPEPVRKARIAAEERACEALRRARSPAYRPARHVALLIALFTASVPDQAKPQIPSSPSVSVAT